MHTNIVKMTIWALMIFLQCQLVATSSFYSTKSLIVSNPATDLTWLEDATCKTMVAPRVSSVALTEFTVDVTGECVTASGVIADVSDRSIVRVQTTLLSSTEPFGCEPISRTGQVVLILKTRAPMYLLMQVSVALDNDGHLYITEYQVNKQKAVSCSIRMSRRQVLNQKVPDLALRPRGQRSGLQGGGQTSTDTVFVRSGLRELHTVGFPGNVARANALRNVQCLAGTDAANVHLFSRVQATVQLVSSNRAVIEQLEVWLSTNTSACKGSSELRVYRMTDDIMTVPSSGVALRRQLSCVRLTADADAGDDVVCPSIEVAVGVTSNIQQIVQVAYLDFRELGLVGSLMTQAAWQEVGSRPQQAALDLSLADDERILEFTNSRNHTKTFVSPRHPAFPETVATATVFVNESVLAVNAFIVVSGGKGASIVETHFRADRSASAVGRALSMPVYVSSLRGEDTKMAAKTRMMVSFVNSGDGGPTLKMWLRNTEGKDPRDETGVLSHNKVEDQRGAVGIVTCVMDEVYSACNTMGKSCGLTPKPIEGYSTVMVHAAPLSKIYNPSSALVQSGDDEDDECEDTIDTQDTDRHAYDLEEGIEMINFNTLDRTYYSIGTNAQRTSRSIRTSMARVCSRTTFRWHRGVLGSDLRINTIFNLPSNSETSQTFVSGHDPRIFDGAEGLFIGRFQNTGLSHPRNSLQERYNIVFKVRRGTSDQPHMYSLVVDFMRAFTNDLQAGNTVVSAPLTEEVNGNPQAMRMQSAFWTQAGSMMPYETATAGSYRMRLVFHLIYVTGSAPGFVVHSTFVAATVVWNNDTMQPSDPTFERVGLVSVENYQALTDFMARPDIRPAARRHIMTLGNYGIPTGGVSFYGPGNVEFSTAFTMYRPQDTSGYIARLEYMWSTQWDSTGSNVVEMDTSVTLTSTSMNDVYAVYAVAVVPYRINVGQYMFDAQSRMNNYFHSAVIAHALVLLRTSSGPSPIFAIRSFILRGVNGRVNVAPLYPIFQEMYFIDTLFPPSPTYPHESLMPSVEGVLSTRPYRRASMQFLSSFRNENGDYDNNLYSRQDIFRPPITGFPRYDFGLIVNMVRDGTESNVDTIYNVPFNIHFRVNAPYDDPEMRMEIISYPAITGVDHGIRTRRGRYEILTINMTNPDGGNSVPTSESYVTMTSATTSVQVEEYSSIGSSQSELYYSNS